MEASKGEMVSAYLQVPIISTDIPVTVPIFGVISIRLI